MEDIYKYDLKSVHYKGVYIVEFYDRESVTLDVDRNTLEDILSKTKLKYCEVDEYWKRDVTTDAQYMKELERVGQ